VLIADPYELRWAKNERLADHVYPDDVAPRLTPAAVRSGADVVIVGASTVTGFTPAMVRQAFPEARRPINLSYSCANAQDLGVILPRLEQSTTLKRLIISLDYTLMWPCYGNGNPAFDRRFFAPGWDEPAPEFNRDAVVLAAQVSRTGVLDEPRWRRPPPWLRAPPMTARPKFMALATGYVVAGHGTVTSGPLIPCEAVPALGDVIFPVVRRLAARGVHVDLVAPPYSLASYFRRPVTLGTDFGGAGLFPRLMAIRRCALEMSAGLPNVRFFSFDDDLPLVGDLNNYADFAHLHSGKPYQMLLQRIAAGSGVVRPEDWSTVEARLKAELNAYALPVSPATGAAVSAVSEGNAP
jgi:hypothetical protein